MAAYRRDPPDVEFAVHHLAVALEHLAKAHLAVLHPTLLASADNNLFDTLLVLTGHGARTQARMRTVSLTEACKRVRRVLPAFQISDEELAQLGDARGGIAHVGMWSRTRVRSLIAIVLARIDVLLESADADLTAWWGEFAEFSKALVDEQANEVALRVNEKIRLASVGVMALTSQMESWDADLPRQVLDAMAREEPFWGPTQATARTKCPACGTEGWLLGEEVVVEGMYDMDGQSVSGRELEVAAFHCGVCRLHLEDWDQITAADLPTAVELPPWDDDWEPDEDYWLDR
jgi:hypothetical protein